MTLAQNTSSTRDWLWARIMACQLSPYLTSRLRSGIVCKGQHKVIYHTRYNDTPRSTQAELRWQPSGHVSGKINATPG